MKQFFTSDSESTWRAAIRKNAKQQKEETDRMKRSPKCIVLEIYYILIIRVYSRFG